MLNTQTMIDGVAPYRGCGRRKRCKCFKPKPRRVSCQHVERLHGEQILKPREANRVEQAHAEPRQLGILRGVGSDGIGRG